MIRKLELRGYPSNVESALSNVYDAVRVRVVCSFVDDVYKVSQWLGPNDEFVIAKTKDYIAYPKPNGYRTLHLILCFLAGSGQGFMAEILLRTIAIDEVIIENAFLDAFRLLADNFDDVLDSVLCTIEDVLKDDIEFKRVKQLEKEMASIETKKAG